MRIDGKKFRSGVLVLRYASLFPDEGFNPCRGPLIIDMYHYRRGDPRDIDIARRDSELSLHGLLLEFVVHLILATDHTIHDANDLSPVQDAFQQT